MSRIWSLGTLLLVLATGFPAAQATTVRSFTLPELATEADRIVLGTIGNVRTFWNNEHDTIYTEYDITVERMIKGTPATVLTVRLMGGRVGDVKLSIEGNGSMEPAERVLVVVRDQESYSTLVGMSQGKWSIRTIDGIEYAFRGRPRTSPAREDGEIPLSDLLKKLSLPAPAQ